MGCPTRVCPFKIRSYTLCECARESHVGGMYSLEKSRSGLGTGRGRDSGVMLIALTRTPSIIQETAVTQDPGQGSMEPSASDAPRHEPTQGLYGWITHTEL